MKPLVGITCNYDSQDKVGRASYMGTAGQDWDFVSGDYIYSVERAGGAPAIIPRTLKADALRALIDRLDGVVITGGHDIDPALYGERITSKCGTIVPERDAYDLEVAKYAFETGKPILAICRGIQILNVAMGGTLYQDLPSAGFEAHSVESMPREYPVHTVTFTEGSLLREIYGKSLKVNSFHHQAVREPGKGVTVTGQSEDGVIEGVEVSGGNPFVVGVQWHPEMMQKTAKQQKVFAALVDACSK